MGTKSISEKVQLNKMFRIAKEVSSDFKSMWKDEISKTTNNKERKNAKNAFTHYNTILEKFINYVHGINSKKEIEILSNNEIDDLVDSLQDVLIKISDNIKKERLYWLVENLSNLKSI